MRRTRRQGTPPSLFLGLAITALGTVLLLDQLGVMRARDLFWYWPLGLVAVGVAKLIAPDREEGRLWGTVLVLGGLVTFFHRAGYFRIDWSMLWSVGLIAIGGHMLWRALFRKQMEADGDKRQDLDLLNEWVVFGGVNMRNESQSFRGGELIAVFGGYEADLSQARMENEEAVLHLYAVFGGVELKVPRDWTVVNKGVAIFGGYEDKTAKHMEGIESGQKLLIVKGLAVFGGVELKNSRERQ
jgi:predicted membrane protein